jgi:hypothetical protein
MIEAPFLSVSQARTPDDLLTELNRFAGTLEFELVSLTLILDRAGGETELIGVDNAPDAYRERFDDPDAGRHDPVSQHCKHRRDPIVWDRSPYVRAAKEDVWDVSISIRLPDRNGDSTPSSCGAAFVHGRGPRQGIASRGWCAYSDACGEGTSTGPDPMKRCREAHE